MGTRQREAVCLHCVQETMSLDLTTRTEGHSIACGTWQEAPYNWTNKEGMGSVRRSALQAELPQPGPRLV